MTQKQNRILAMLPPQEYLRLEPELELVSLTQGEVLQESGSSIDFLHFPTTSLVSVVREDDDATLQLAMTGNDGVVGVSVSLGVETSAYRMIVLASGEAYRVRAEVMQWLFEQGGHLPLLSVRYAEYLMSQIAQTALCNHHHRIEQQVCRWMLLCLDHLQGGPLEATQEMMAAMVGARRASISDAAVRLHEDGVIAYSRGKITVLDRAGLEARACGCYAALRRETERLLDLPPAAANAHRPGPRPKTIRERAEKRLQLKALDAPLDPANSARLIHELQVHQIELEIQNEELASLYADANSLRDHYADVYDFAPVSYVTLDEAGAIRQINLAGAILLGIKRSQVPRHRFGASVSPASLPAFNDFLREVLGRRTRLDCELQLAATSQRDVATVHIEAISDEAGQECRMVITDITERQRIVEELDRYRHHLEAMVQERTAALLIAKEAAETANRAKSMFLANVSHELRTPLNGVIGMTAIAMRRVTDPTVLAQLEKALDSANRLLALIEDLLEMSAIGVRRMALNRTLFHVGDVLSAVARSMAPSAAKKGLVLSSDIPPEIARLPLVGDAVRLKEILEHLVDNAVKFTEQGSIVLDVRLLEDAPVNALLRFTVKDSGIGMSADVQQRIFTLFEQGDNSLTRKYGGTGIGLALCRQLVELMGGRIGATSREGAGSTFWFELRLDKPTDAEPDDAH